MAGQIFPLESMAAAGGLGLLFGEREANDIIRKRHINGKILKPKTVKNSFVNKQKEMQP